MLQVIQLLFIHIAQKSCVSFSFIYCLRCVPSEMQRDKLLFRVAYFHDEYQSLLHSNKFSRFGDLFQKIIK